MTHSKPPSQQILDSVALLSAPLVVKIILRLQDGALGKRDIREGLGHSNQAISETIRWLQNSGFLGGGETRQQPLYLTDWGEKLLQWYQEGRMFLLTID